MSLDPGSKPGETDPGSVDPRIERSRLVVRRAALAELGERGYGGFAVDSVAARAGVARSTVYRHWPDKLALITDSLEVLNQQPAPSLDAETPRARVHVLLVHLAQALTDSPFSSCIPALIEAAEHNPEVGRFLYTYSTARRRALEDAISAGIEAGDFPPSVEPGLAARALSGAVFYQRLMTGEPFEPDRTGDLVDLVLGQE